MELSSDLSSLPPAASYSGADRPLRILMVVESSGGGTGRHVLDLSEGLIARGCDVHLLYSQRRMDGQFRDRLSALPALHRAILPMRTNIHPNDLSVVRAARRYIGTFGPFDIVHGHSSKGGAIARLAALFKGAAAFYTIHGLIMMDPQLPGWKRMIYRNIERVLSLVTARIIAVSPEEARAAARMKLGRSKLVLVPNGIGNMTLAPRAEARSLISIPENSLVIGFIGRLVMQKAPDVLLRAFAGAAAAAVPASYLAMVGTGPLENELRDLASQLKIASRVRWLGERDARAVLAGFDVFALASRKEGLPYVVLEAMAAGLPIVATATAGVECLLQNGQNGFVVPPDDPAAFSHALIELMSDPRQRSALGQASLRRVGRFTLGAMVDGTLRAYRTALQTQGQQFSLDIAQEVTEEVA